MSVEASYACRESLRQVVPESGSDALQKYNNLLFYHILMGNLRPAPFTATADTQTGTCAARLSDKGFTAILLVRS
jgi:ferric iron reductase protein FhuF